MTLSLTRAEDRKQMASEIENIAAEVGATAIRQISSIAPRLIRVFIETPRGLCVFVELNGDTCQPDIFVLPYHMALHSDATLSRHFGFIAGAEVNPHHRQKCTAVVSGFDYMKQRLRMALEAAMDGSAFEEVSAKSNDPAA